ncbi:MAG: class I SAM-dependent methyltransferase [Symploca sp. SIO2E6]|nr:class I SAM-dependent methyltransferase [Symploca sp. SIO2E6]
MDLIENSDYFLDKDVVKKYDSNVISTIPFYSECIEFIAKVVENFQGGKKIDLLELGIGTGNLTCALLDCIEKLGNLYCLDMSESMLSLAKEKILKSGLAADRVTLIKKLFLDDWEMDVKSKPSIISSMMCFSHLINDSDAKKVFDKCYQILDSGGLFIISEKCASSNGMSRCSYERMIANRAILLERGGFMSSKQIEAWKYHVLVEDKIRSLKEWAALLKNVGFVITKSSGIKLPNTNFNERDFVLLKTIEDVSSSTEQALGMGMIFCIKT